MKRQSKHKAPIGMSDLYVEAEVAAGLAKIAHLRVENDGRAYTDQASAALQRAASAGPKIRTGEYIKDSSLEFITDRQGKTCTYSWRGAAYLASHRVVLKAQEDKDMDVLLALCREQDTDTAYLATYLTNLLKPGERSVIDLHLTARAIGSRVDKMNHEEQLVEMGSIWSGLLWLSRATVVGQRTKTYTERVGREKREISTRVSEPLILIRRWYQAETMPLPGMMGEVYGEKYEALYLGVPRVVELEISPEWCNLVSATSLGEFLTGFKPVMELSGNQPAGAWARSIALSLASLWRREADKFLDAISDISVGRTPSTLLPRMSRHDLISTFPPTKAPLDKIMLGSDPKRAVEYWAQALQLLVECKFLEPYGDARSVEEAQMRRNSEGTPNLERKGWKFKWSESSVTLLPGPAIVPALQVAIKKDMAK